LPLPSAAGCLYFFVNRHGGTPMGKLDGKVALVTGSGRNIGRATVLKLAGEGAHVVVNARSNRQEAESVAREARERGVKALVAMGDVGKRDEVEGIAQQALAEFGRVDILINNAAIRPHKPFMELTVAEWEHVRGIVLDGALYLTRALIEPMVKNKYGQILFFVGDGAFSGRGAGRVHISAAKMGLIGMARALASEFAPHNIRVNVVSPGSIDTRRDHPEWYQGRAPSAEGIPLGRQGHVDEIAAACLFLVSEDGGFITGQTLHVNGGAGYY
jgi:3-oxoacyl-[acyl-carrier protein] reductase